MDPQVRQQIQFHLYNLAVVILVIFAGSVSIRYSLFHRLPAEDKSMHPEVEPETFFRLERRVRSPQDGLARYDIVGWRAGRGDDRIRLARVYAWPGEWIGIEGGVIRYGDTIEGMTPVRETFAAGGTPDDLPPVRVPAGHVFLLIDRRDSVHPGDGKPTDSRDSGPVPEEFLLGRYRKGIF